MQSNPPPPAPASPAFTAISKRLESLFVFAPTPTMPPAEMFAVAGQAMAQAAANLVAQISQTRLPPHARKKAGTEALRCALIADACMQHASALLTTAAHPDTVRLDWLQAHPLPAQIHGGAEDGHTGTFWGLGAHSGTLREAIDLICAQTPAKG